MKPKAILGMLLAGAVGIPVLTVLTNRVVGDPNVYWDITYAVVTAVGSTLAALWVTVLDGYLVVRTRRDPVRGGVVPLALIGGAMLLIGFGSTALAAWEEVQAGQPLPIINLFIFLIPLGLILMVIAFVLALADGKRASGARSSV